MRLIKEDNRELWLNDDGKKHGEFKRWHNNGQLMNHCFWVNDGLHGEYKSWYSDGQIHDHCFWVNDEIHGESKWWSANGQIRFHTYYSHGKVLRDLLKEPADEEDKFMLTLKHGGQWLWN